MMISEGEFVSCNTSVLMFISQRVDDHFATNLFFSLFKPVLEN